MAAIGPLLGAQTRLGQIIGRLRAALATPQVPDYCSPADGHELWLRQLERIRHALELGRAVIARDGFTSGAWFTVAEGSRTRKVEVAEAFALRDPRSPVVNACLIGTLVRLADDPDRVPSLADVWGCVDELYEAIHEQAGHPSFPPGRVYPLVERRGHLQGLTAWNDAPGRTVDQVLDLLDRAISRTIMAACRAIPSPATASANLP